MIRILILMCIGAVISASSFSVDHIQFPFGLEGLFGRKPETSVRNQEKERSSCETEECKLIAKIIKESMDESLDPCNDFYDYACGKWSSNNPIPENMSSWSLWNMVQDKIDKQIEDIIKSPIEPKDLFAVKLAKKWYHTCMDEEQESRGLESLISTIWRHGGWPLIMEEGEWDSRVYKWQTVDDQYARLTGLNVFHDLLCEKISWDGNDTLILESAHLPFGIYNILSYEYEGTDSSDENNESGEGSQEKGSKERKSPNENDEGDEGIEEDEEEEESDTEEELRNRRVSRRKSHKILGHKKRASNKHSVSRRHNHERKNGRRTKRDLIKDIMFSKIRSQKRNSKHVARGKSKKTSGRSRHRHLSVGHRHRTTAGKNDLKAKGKDKDTSVKPEDNKKHVGHNSGKKHEVKDNKERKKVNEQHGSGKRRHKRDKGLEKHVAGGKTISGNHQHKQRRINHHRVHHVAKKMQDKDTENEDDSDTKADSGDNEEDDSGNGSDAEDTESNGDDEQTDGDDDESDTEYEDNDDEDDQEDEDDDDEDNQEDEDDDDEDDQEDEDDDDSDEESSKEELTERYRKYMLTLATMLSKVRGIEIPQEKMEKDVNDLLEFSIKLGEIMKNTFDPENTTLDTFQEEFDALKSTTPNSKIHWKKKVLKLLSEAGVELEGDLDVMISRPAYFKRLHALLDKTPAEVIVNYIHWLLVDRLAPLISQDVRNLSGNWMGEAHETREHVCMSVELSDVLAYQYARRHFPEKIEKTARDMIDDIQKEVEYQIKQSTWMDEDTKHFVLDKLVHMENMIGYPDWFKNTTAVKLYFQGLTIGPVFYENVLNYLRYRKWKEFRKMEDTEIPEVSVDPLMLNAFFVPTDNSIAISAADLQNPFFALNRPWNVNFGIIGVVMAHEVNHGFDNEGHLYDMSGKPMEWLSAMASAYDKRAECFVNQYNQYDLIKGQNFTVKDYGNKTAGENIADTMGLQAVFRAYQRRLRECDKPDPALPGLEKFDNNQTFFLAFANLWCETEDPVFVKRTAKYDVHSPSRLRVIGSVSNLDEFAEAFNCPAGSPMNPKNKCNIWT